MKATVLKYKLLIISFIVFNCLSSFGQTTTIINAEQFNTASAPVVPGTWTPGAWDLNYNYATNCHNAASETRAGSIAAGTYNSYFWIPISFVDGYNYTLNVWRKNANNMRIVFNETADLTTPLATETIINATAAWTNISFTTYSNSYTGNGYIGICATTGNGSRMYVDDITLSETAQSLSAHPASFSATSGSDCNSIDLSFSSPSTISKCKGYLVLQKIGSVPTGIPSNGNSYTVGSVIGDATVAALITNTASVSATISGLNGNTNYFYSIIPFNYNGTNSTSYRYYTSGTINTASVTTSVCIGLSSEPTSHPAVFTTTIFPSCGSLALGFSPASTITDCFGYIIMKKQNSSSIATPVDGVSYNIGSAIGDATVVANITNLSTSTYTDTGLPNATQYYYYIFPYNYDGTNAISYNYKTSSALTANQVTIWCEDLVGSPIGNQGGGYHTPGVGPHGNYTNWWAVNLYDKVDMHNGSSSSAHNILSSICVDLNRSDPNWSSSAVSSTLDNINIYMANYNNVSTFTSAYTSESALNTGTGVTWTLVYSGSITFAGLGWQQINLQTPFYYNGTGSLLVKFTRVSGNTPSNYPTFGFMDASPTSEIRNLNQTQVNPSYKYMKMAFNSTCTASINATGVILPIELTRFEGDCNNGNVILNWQTATEKNNKVFIIQRSNDGVYFETIGSVAGAGNSDQLRNYTFIDESKLDGISYYRLNQTDYNGKKSQSKIIAVDHQCGENMDTEISVYPNPSQDNAFVSLKLMNRSLIQMEVYNSVGQLVKLIPNQEYETGLQDIDIKAYEFPTGIYFIKVIIDNKTYLQKFVKL